jgi:hypothetical protein
MKSNKIEVKGIKGLDRSELKDVKAGGFGGCAFIGEEIVVYCSESFTYVERIQEDISADHFFFEE